MADYMSPNSFATPNTFQVSGTAGGFLAGQNQAMLQQMMNRQFIASDLQNQIENYAAQLKGAQLPGEEQAARNNLSAQTAIGQNWQRGADGSPAPNVQALNTGVQADIGKNVLSQTTSASGIQNIQMTTMAGIGQQIQNNGGSLDLNNPADKQLNDELVARARAVNINFPNGVIDSNTAKNLINYYNTKKNSIDFQQKAQLQTQSEASKANVAEIQAAPKYYEAQAKQAIAQMRNQTDLEKTQMLLGNKSTAEQLANTTARMILRQDPSTVTQQEMDGLFQTYYGYHFADAQATDLIKLQAQLRIDHDKDSYDKAVANLQNQSRTAAMSDIMGNPSLKKLWETTHGASNGQGTSVPQVRPTEQSGFTLQQPGMTSGNSSLQAPILGLQQSTDPKTQGYYVVKSTADYDKVKSGMKYIAPDGIPRTKP